MLLLHRASQATTEFKRVTAIKHVTNDSSPPTKLLHFFFKLTFLISITRVPKENPYILEITLITSARKNLILQPLLPLALQLPLFARKPLLHREHNLLRFTSFSQWENKQFLFPEKWGLPSSVMTILMGKRKPKWNLLLRIFQFKLGNGLFVLHRGMSMRVFSLFVAPPSFPLWRNLQLLLLLHPIYPTLSCHTWMNLGSSTKQNRSSLALS